MADKEFFYGQWRVRQRNNDSSEVARDQRFVIKDAGGDKVSFTFLKPFGDGCWNTHIQHGTFANGRITAPIVDDGTCSPPPGGDTLLIKEDVADRMVGAKRIRCRVFTRPSLEEPVARGVEQAGEFGAEDDGD